MDYAEIEALILSPKETLLEAVFEPILNLKMKFRTQLLTEKTKNKTLTKITSPAVKTGLAVFQPVAPAYKRYIAERKALNLKPIE